MNTTRSHGRPRPRPGSRRAPGPDQHARADRRTARRPAGDGRRRGRLLRRTRPRPRGGSPRRRRAGRATPGSQRIREARAALRELWDAQVEGRAPDGHALRTLNAILDRGPRVELRATLAGVEVAHRHRNDDPTGEALARTATPLVEAIAAGESARFRICANDGCRWVFEDTSRAGRRRWCDMATCGNRAKVRRFRSRRRDAGGGAPGPARLPRTPSPSRAAA